MSEQHSKGYYVFRKETIEDRDQTKVIGKVVFKEVDVVDLRSVGSKDFTTRSVAWLQKHDPKTWALVKPEYEPWLKGQEPPLDGTPLKTWALISAAHCRTLMEHGVKTIEQLAKINDETMKLIPMDGRRLQQTAAAYLSADRQAERAAVEITNIKEEMSRMRASLEASEALNRELAAGLEKRGPGRPRKEEAA